MRKNGFTLVEMLVVLVVIGVLTGIAIPTLRNSFLKAKVTSTIANMKVLKDALWQYNSDFGYWPNTLNVNTFEPLVQEGYMSGNQVKIICAPLFENRLGAYTFYGPQNDFLIFFKMQILPKIQFYLFPDGVYIKNPETNQVEKFTEKHFIILLRQK